MKDSLGAKIEIFWEQGHLYIFLAGLVFLIFLLSPRVGIYDWQKELFYFDYIKTALVNYQTWPYFVWQIPGNISWYPALAQTHNFAGNPEVVLFSPFLPLLYFVSAVTYFKLLVFLHFLIGVAGSVALKRRLAWNNQQFRVFLALFLFSPIIIQHLAIGYSSYFNLFYFPWLIYFLLSRKAATQIFGCAAILSLALLQGGNHIFVWFGMFAILYLVFYPLAQMLVKRINQPFGSKSVATIFKGLAKASISIILIFVSTALLSFVRLFATAKSFGDFAQSFLTGYRGLDFVFWALVPPVLVFPFDRLFVTKIIWGVPSWDAGIFFGLGLVMAAVLIKNFRQLVKTSPLAEPDNRGALLSILLVVLLLGLLSFFNLFESAVSLIFSLTRLPFIMGAEKYPFRLMIPAFLGLSVVLAHFAPQIWQSMAGWLGQRQFGHRLSRILKIAVKWLCLAGAAVLTIGFLVSLVPSQIPRLQDLLQTPRYSAYYLQYQLAALVLAIFLFAGYLLLKHLPRLRQVHRFVGYELLLMVPLLFATYSWLTVAVSREPLVYDAAQMFSPALAADSPSFKPAPVKVTPKEILFQANQDQAPAKYEFTDISFKDGNVLEPVNADFSSRVDQKGSTLVLEQKPGQTGDFGLAYKTRPFYFAFYVTIASWLALAIGAASLWLIKRLRQATKQII